MTLYRRDKEHTTKITTRIDLYYLQAKT